MRIQKLCRKRAIEGTAFWKINRLSQVTPFKREKDCVGDLVEGVVIDEYYEGSSENEQICKKSYKTDTLTLVIIYLKDTVEYGW